MTGEQPSASAPAIDIGTMATLACLWEATAPKPGNVYRGADFEDVTYAEFVASAAVVGPIVARAAEHRFGATLLAAVEATQQAVATNTNLGTLLLLVPLAAVDAGTFAEQTKLAQQFLDGTTPEDTRLLYQAIRCAQAGGLGEVDDGDVQHEPPETNVVEVMKLAADRDTIARQFVNGFAEVQHAAKFIEDSLHLGECLSEAIVAAALDLHAHWPDTLIERKLGAATAQDASSRAGVVLSKRDESSEAYLAARADFDFWLRSDGHRRNPGTTADLIAAALFTLLRSNRIGWPVRFFG